MTLRLTTSTETAANFVASYHARKQRKQSGRPWQPPKRTTIEDAAQFRAFVLSKVGRLTPKWPTQIRREVEDDWGSICWRRLERAIKWLRDDGKIVRTSNGYLLAPRRRQ